MKKEMRNPVNRSKLETNPAGVPMMELAELELGAISGAGKESDGGSCGILCTWSSECQGRYTISCCE